MTHTKTILSTAALIASLAFAGIASADGGRDTGVGRLIAVQGNAALTQLRQELHERVCEFGPAPLPAHPYHTALSERAAAHKSDGAS